MPRKLLNNNARINHLSKQGANRPAGLLAPCLDSLSSVGHKLTWREEGDLPKDEFRLGLAIVTLLCFLILILAFAGLSFTSLASDKYLYIGTGIVMFILFSIVAIIIKTMFNRRR